MMVGIRETDHCLSFLPPLGKGDNPRVEDDFSCVCFELHVCHGTMEDEVENFVLLHLSPVVPLPVSWLGLPDFDSARS